MIIKIAFDRIQSTIFFNESGHKKNKRFLYFNKEYRIYKMAHFLSKKIN